MNPSVLNSLAAGNPIRKLYQKAIDLAQGGKPDNDAKQFRYYVLHQLAWYALTRHQTPPMLFIENPMGSAYLVK